MLHDCVLYSTVITQGNQEGITILYYILQCFGCICADSFTLWQRWQIKNFSRHITNRKRDHYVSLYRTWNANTINIMSKSRDFFTGSVISEARNWNFICHIIWVIQWHIEDDNGLELLQLFNHFCKFYTVLYITIVMYFMEN